MKTISREELLPRLSDGGTVVVNVLARPAYDRIRIKGSISIPKGDLVAGRWAELDRNKEIVVHGSSPSCGASKDAAAFLEEKGFDVVAYEGGIKDWAEGDLPVEGTITSRQYLEERYGRPAGLSASSGS